MSYNNWELIQGNNAGNFTEGGWKLCIHMTEGSSIEGAVGAYRKNNSWPHATIDPKKRRKVRHLNLNVAARSLANNINDGFQVGRANVLQIEIVGFSAEAQNISQSDLDWIAECFNEIRQAQSFPLNHLDFKVPATRLSDRDWVNYAGIVGHQHAPDNDHWDPGDLNIEYIVSKMGGNIPPSNPKGVLVAKTLDYEVNIGCDNSGNGYVDVHHRQGANPTSVTVTANGGVSAGKYPGYAPQFWVSRLDGQYVRITTVKNQGNARFDILVSMNFA